uniref:PH domain-containing protein n=1 Tax=Proboscia inermis TaxID=420281 RepID=A0A7S0C150_9STRA|mmetsp:Transcript_21031/g.21348  ORF Transcript_21031/g.21348 Transcript_21031/m.21348 type:complete len:209 (+) Transcript_21031:257-883(+)
MIYFCNSLVKLTFSVSSKDDSLRPCFVGQAIVDASYQLQRTFVSGVCQRHKVSLGSLIIDPKEFGNKPTFRGDGGSFEGAKKRGYITYEIHPYSNVESKCGVLEEILSAVLKSARKKWFAVLVDKQLLLFSHYNDSKPKVTIPLQIGTHIEWHKDVMIKISTLDQSWYLTTQCLKQRTAWFNKLTGFYREMLDKSVIEMRSTLNRAIN